MVVLLKFRALCFNPRTYIRYDSLAALIQSNKLLFQSTYLYKVRHAPLSFLTSARMFQSTYLYKVRRTTPLTTRPNSSFNPRTYIRYDIAHGDFNAAAFSFNPRTYIRYDLFWH